MARFPLYMAEVVLFLSTLRCNDRDWTGFSASESEHGHWPRVPVLQWTHSQSMQADMLTVTYENCTKALCREVTLSSLLLCVLSRYSAEND